ncbi:MAG: Lrp/AsnC family transcriptional regulator [Nanoarchaeota archaeon]|nr:Lrp/AsnC family transcriptional regulator [Nanoarchaeota archaeon]
MKLDVLDKKILYYLEINSRVPISKLSKLVKASREVVNYRLKKLEENKIIKSYIANVNQSIFCSGIVNMCLKVLYKDDKRYKQIIEFFKNHSKINWFGELCGNYDFTLTILYKNMQDISKSLDDIFEFLGSELQEHNLSFYINEYFFRRKNIFEMNFKEEKLEKEIVFNKVESQNLNLDEKDLIIIKELANNSKIKNIELAKKIKLGEDIVRIRIKNLEKKGIILGYTIVINAYKCGFEGYHLNMFIENFSKINENNIKAFCISNPFIYFASRLSGKFNLDLGIYAKNREHFKKILFEIREFFKDDLKNYEFQLLLDEHKEVFITDEVIC